jgi:GH24 family phage-related lysozyme (muramidase)
MDDEPNETPADDSDKPTDEQPAEPSDDQPTDDQPAEPSDDQPADEQPAEKSDDQPADDQPAEKSDDQPADDQPASESDDQPTDEQPAEKSDDQPSDDQPASESDDKQAGDQPAQQSAGKPAQKSDDKAAPAAGSDGEFRKRCMALLTKHEGRMKHVYLDTLKIPSIGIGFNLKRGGAREALAAVGADYDQVVAGKQDLTDAQIDALFNRDLDSALAGAKRQVSNFADLHFNARLVVVDMMFMGEGAFAGFKKMIAALKNRDYNTAADEMKSSQWYGQVGLRGIEDVALMRGAANG